ncbi:MAG: SusC/RagA family TonB-linked outer membrane protein, partial [Odoribacter sp.]|nr:SusC/RagA family TonB-linked outer membrane protein [Odoribacter sp.]
GTVVDDATGMPLPGVNVLDAKTHKGAVTDVDGRFSLVVPADCQELTVSFIGYKTQKVALRNRQELAIRLQEDTKMMDEVVVTGVQTIEKGRATGSFTLLNQEDMKQIYSTSLTERLEGQVAGLLVDKNNEMTIRGIGSLNADTRPLIVVDGFPLESSELNINPNDIDQITVLKDAASASIWGIRAANGVVVVTTKRGSKNRPLNVSYSGNVTYSGAVDLDDLHIMAADEYAATEFNKYLLQGGYEASNPFYDYTEIEEVYMMYKHQEISLEDAWKKVREIGSFSNRKQIEENFYRHAFTQQHNLSLQAGGERVATYISFSYDQNRSQAVGDETSKYNLLVNNDVNLRKNFTASLGLRATHRNIHRNSEDATEMEPWKRILNDDGSYYWERTGISQAWKDACEALGMKNWDKNLLREQRMNDKKTKDYNVSTSLKLAWQPIAGLDISSQGNYEFGKTLRTDFYSEDHYFTRNLTNRYTQLALDANKMPEEVLGYYLPTSGGIKDFSNYHSISYSVRNMVSWQSSVGEFSYKVMAGNEFYSLEGETVKDRLWGYDPELMTVQTVDLSTLNSGVKPNPNKGTEKLKYTPSVSETLERYTSYFGSAGVTYKERYDLFASVRLDQTNLLTNASKFRNNPSWSVGAKWNIAREDFFKTELVDELMVRLSYGLAGNMDKSTAPDIITQAYDDFDFPINYLTVKNPANPALGWEKTYTVNAGVDFVLLDGRLDGSIDFYNKTSKNLLASANLDPTTGWSSLYKNSAEVSNRGVDLNLHARLLSTSLVKWNLGLNFSYNKNEVTELYYTPTVLSAYRGNPIKGHAIGTIAAVRYGGLDENGDPTIMKAGDDTRYEYAQMSVLTLDDIIYKGPATPPVFGSISSTLKLGDFTLGCMFTYQLGHQLRLPVPVPSMFGLYSEWYGEEHRWVEGQDNSNKWVPKMYPSEYEPANRFRALQYSDQLTDKANVLYLKSLSLEYDATRLLRRIGMKGGSVRISGENLKCWAANKYGIDPAALGESYGVVAGFATKPRMVVGLNLNF